MSTNGSLSASAFFSRTVVEMTAGTAFVAAANAVTAFVWFPSVSVVSAMIFGGSCKLIYDLTHIACDALLPEHFYASIFKTVAAFTTALIGGMLAAKGVGYPIAATKAILITAPVVATGVLFAIVSFGILYRKEAGSNASMDGFESWIDNRFQ